MLSKKITKKNNLKKKYCYDDDEKKYVFIAPPFLNEVDKCYEWNEVEVKVSSKKSRGSGLFAKRDLKVNTLIPYGGELIHDISKLTKKIKTSSYLVSCGVGCTGPWRDGNPNLIADFPSNSWVGIYVNEPDYRKTNEKHNADLFTWNESKVEEVPDYPHTNPINAVFIRIMKPIKAGEEIFVQYYWSAAQQRRRGYKSKSIPPEFYFDKDEEVITPPTKIRKHGRGAISDDKHRIMNFPNISAAYKAKKKSLKVIRANRILMDLHHR